MSRIKYPIFLLALLYLAASVSFAQVGTTSDEERYYDFLVLEGLAERPTLGYRTLSDNVWSPTQPGIWAGHRLSPSEKTFRGGVKLSIYDPELFSSYNSAHPYGQNDGGLWQGRGLNATLSAGATLSAKGFSITIKPALHFSQNEDFKRMPGVYGSEYSYFWKGEGSGLSIDLVQRFGDSPFTKFDWGDSEIRYTWKKLTVGAGFQSPWLGPAWINPIIGSNNAPPYPKVDFGLRRTGLNLGKWYAGEVEARLWAGRLSESEYFDDDTDNNHNLLSGLSLSYSPSFWSGLTINLNRTFLSRYSDGNLRYVGQLILPGFINTIDGSDGKGEDQRVTLGMNQTIPSIEMEIYAEVGVDDYSHDYVTIPFHTMVFNVGVRKAFNLPRGWKGELTAEFNTREISQDYHLQWVTLGFYSHHQLTQGYTNEGQIIGSGYGYAGNSQWFSFKMYHPKGYVMPFVHRSCPDNNYIYAKPISARETPFTFEDLDRLEEEYYSIHKTYLEAGVQALQFVSGHMQLSASLSGVYIKYPLYKTGEDPLLNLRLTFGLKYKLF